MGSQLHTAPPSKPKASPQIDPPARTVTLDLHTDADADAPCCDDCTCEGCSGPSSFAFAATCAMVGASTKSDQPKALRARLITQCFYWSVSLIAAVVSLRALLPIMSEPVREWFRINLLNP